MVRENDEGLFELRYHLRHVHHVVRRAGFVRTTMQEDDQGQAGLRVFVLFGNGGVVPGAILRVAGDFLFLEQSGGRFDPARGAHRLHLRASHGVFGLEFEHALPAIQRFGGELRRLAPLRQRLELLGVVGLELGLAQIVVADQHLVLEFFDRLFEPRGAAPGDQGLVGLRRGILGELLALFSE